MTRRKNVRKVSFKKRRKSRKKNPKINAFRLATRPISKYAQSSIFPNTKMYTMRYVEKTNFTSSNGTSTNAFYNLCSIWDPNSSGTGGSAFGITEVKVAYNRYTVLGCKATFQFYNIAASATPVVVGVLFDDDTSISSVLRTKMERSANRQSKLLLTNSREKATITMYYNPKKAFKAYDIKDDNFHSTFSSSPSKAYYAHPWVQSADSLTTSSEIGCLITLEFAVLASEPHDLV